VIGAVLLVAWLGPSAPLVVGLGLGFLLCALRNVREHVEAHAFDVDYEYEYDDEHERDGLVWL
jgi:hypothetical protein